MGKEIKHVLVYVFEGDVPENLSGESPARELFYDKYGRIVRETRGVEQLYYSYDWIDDGRRAVRLFHDYGNGIREYTEDETDHEYYLVHTHWERQDMWGIPLEYFDEWHDWSLDGKTRTRTKEIHRSDGTIGREVRTEEYNDLGWLRRVHHLDDDFNYEYTETLFHSFPDGTLLLKIHRTVFTTKEGLKRIILTRERYQGEERLLSVESFGDNEAGHPFHHFTTYEYEVDAEGNWTRCRTESDICLNIVTVRIIDYWE